MAVNTDLVVISPHFDDAVLSVGALISARVAAGQRVQVMTVYTARPPSEGLSGRRRTFGDYATRCDEDDRALAILGATTYRLGLRERLFRDPPLSRGTQVFRTPPQLADFTERVTVERAIAQLLSEPAVRILAPLGIGNHHDHVEVAVAAMRAVIDHEAGDRIMFYEDFNALSQLWRRRHPVARTAPYPWRSAPTWASPVAGIPMEAMSLLSRGPASSDLAGQSPGSGGGIWTAEVVSAIDHEQAKLRAIAQYRTQLRVLGGADRIAAMIRRSHRRRGGEILWRLDSANPPIDTRGAGQAARPCG